MNIPPQEIPDGVDYQLVTIAVMGDRSLGQLAEFEKTGWRRVPVGRHPAIESVDSKWIENGGLALVERPKYLTERAKVWETNKADAQICSVISNMGLVGRVNSRPINTKATIKRKRTFKEFFVFHGWRFRIWCRDRYADWRAK